MAAYYNDNDPQMCAWLRELIKDGQIAPGDVDERSIKEISADDLKGYTQHHFFAGIGGWSYALRLASWPDDKPVWTASLPCQPFSAAGKGLGEKDERHLWPAFRKLVSTYKPSVIFGEQVASKLGREWLSTIRFDLENIIYWEYYEEALHRLRKAQSTIEISEILGEIIGRVEATLYGLPKGIRRWMEEGKQGEVEIDSPGKEGQRKNLSPKIQPHTSRGDSSERGHQAFKEKGASMRSPRPYSRDRSTIPARDMRNDGATSHVRRSSGLEQCLTGQNQSQYWIHILKHSSSLFWDECGIGALGGEGAFEDAKVLAGEETINDEQAIEHTFRALIASSIIRIRLAGVRTDLETLGYAVGAADLCAAGVGSPQIRQRLWWISHAPISRNGTFNGQSGQSAQPQIPAGGHDLSGRLRDTESKQTGYPRQPREGTDTIDFWDDFDVLPFADGKARRVEPGTFPLATRLPSSVVPNGDPSVSYAQATAEARVMRLRGYGNSIVPQVAAKFIIAFMEVIDAI